MSIQDKLKKKEVLEALILIKLACLTEDINLESVSFKIKDKKEIYSIELPDVNLEEYKDKL